MDACAHTAFLWVKLRFTTTIITTDRRTYNNPARDTCYADQIILYTPRRRVLRQLTVTVLPQVSLTLARSYSRRDHEIKGEKAKKRRGLSRRSSGTRSKHAPRTRGESNAAGRNRPTAINPQDRTGNQLNLAARRHRRGLEQLPASIWSPIRQESPCATRSNREKQGGNRNPGPWDKVRERSEER